MRVHIENEDSSTEKNAFGATRPFAEGDWEKVGLYVSKENVRGQRARSGQECLEKWAYIQHGAVVHELKLAVRMSDTKRLRETVETARTVGYSGAEVEEAQALLSQLDSGKRSVQHMREVSAAGARAQLEADGPVAEMGESDNTLAKLRSNLREASSGLTVPGSQATEGEKVLTVRDGCCPFWISNACRVIDRSND